MVDLFLQMLSYSMKMSIIIIILLLISRFLSNEYSTKWRYYVWLMVAVGLIIPVRPNIYLPQININNQFEKNSWNGLNYIDNNWDKITHKKTDVKLQNIEFTRIFILKTLSFIWLSGIIYIMSYNIIKYNRFRKKLKRWIDDDLENSNLYTMLIYVQIELEITCEVGLKRAPIIASPILIGFIKPVIILPDIEYSDEEVKFILKHELVHFKRKDVWSKLFILCATSIHWYNPLVWIMANRINLLNEMSCDSEVIAGCSHDERKQYGETIIKFIRERTQTIIVLSTNFYGGKLNMKKRILNIMDMKKRKFSKVYFAIIMIGVIILGCNFIINKEDEKYLAASPDNKEEIASNGIKNINNETYENKKVESNYTDDDYKKLLKYKTDDYEKQTVKKFNDLVKKDYDTIAMIFEGYNFKDKNSSYLTSLYYSITEIGFERDNVNESQIGVSIANNDKNKEKIWLSGSYTLYWKVNDKKSITVEERDTALNKYQKKVIDYVYSLKKSELKSKNLKVNMEKEFKQLSKKLSNKKISIKGVINFDRLEVNE